MKWTALHAQYALARHFNWFQNQMMPEFAIDGFIADLLFVTPSGYATEVEIKMSLSDWNADQRKRKFERARPHIARFFYAAPRPLIERAPAWVPAHCGLLALVSETRVQEVRAARRTPGAQKITDRHRTAIAEACYYRFWQREMRHRREAIYRLNERA